MGAAWSGSIAQLKKLVDTGTFIQEIYRGFAEIYHPPSLSEMKSWEESIPALLLSLSDSKFNNLQIIIELAMPTGTARCDVVLLGGNSETPRFLVIELKQWRNIKVNPDTFEVEVSGLDLQQHPSLQALYYTGKLHFFSAKAHTYEDYSAVYLHNASDEDIKLLVSRDLHELVLVW